MRTGVLECLTAPTEICAGPIVNVPTRSARSVHVVRRLLTSSRAPLMFVRMCIGAELTPCSEKPGTGPGLGSLGEPPPP